MRVILIMLCVATVTASASAQHTDSSRVGYGVYGDVNVNLHMADFTGLPGVPSCCPQYSSGEGLGTSLGVFAEIPVADQLALLLRAGYMSYGATLTSDEPMLVNVDGQAVQGMFRHTLTAQLSTVGLEPLLAWRVSRGLSLLGGVQAGYVLRSHADQLETIVEPGEGVFTDTGLPSRNAWSGDIPGASSFTSFLSAGARYDLPMNDEGTLHLQPELLVSMQLTRIQPELAWRALVLRGGFALRYTPRPAEPAVQAVVLPPPPPPSLEAGVQATGVDANGVESPVAQVRVEEFVSREMRPLLPYLFFAAGESSLPARYPRLDPAEAPQFRIESLRNADVLTTYHRILDIVGRRMTEDATARLAITGATDGSEAERAVPDLAQQRAEAVREYIQRVWRIDPSRLSVSARVLPEKPSSQSEPDGVEENRRVELSGTPESLLDPLVVDDTLRTVDPPVIRFRPWVKSDAGLVRWSLPVSQSTGTVASFAGEWSMPDSIDWNLAADRELVHRLEPELRYGLSVTDAAAQSITTELPPLPVEQLTVQRKRSERLGDREIARYNLILFDFDSETLDARNQRIAAMVRGAIRPASTVRVTGYTDRIGESAHNQKLSEARARATARALDASSAEVRGLGESTLYTNDLPEGRFYCRTVGVVIETPVE